MEQNSHMQTRPLSSDFHDKREPDGDDDQAAHESINTTSKRQLSASDSTTAHLRAFLFSFFYLSFFVPSNFAAFCI